MNGKNAVIAGIVMAGFLAAGCGSVHTASSDATQQSSPSPASATPVAAPSPNGTYQGACNYDLGSNPVGGTAVATGDVQVKNTGNIGTHLHVKITWPQQGYAPLAMSKNIRLKPGASQDVQFHMPLTQDQLSNLQNWQTGHDYSDGCTYKSTITSTFGSAS